MQTAQERGGVCLSETYLGHANHHWFRCAEGHDVVAERLQTDASHPEYHEHQLSNKGYRADGLAAAERLAHRERGADDAV